jgi:hypothetical protein
MLDEANTGRLLPGPSAESYKNVFATGLTALL